MATEVVSWTYDTIEPSQWFGCLYGRQLDNGLQRLSLAIILDALRDLGPSSNPRHRNDALAWFQSDDLVPPFSFRNICDILGLKVATMRAKLNLSQPKRLRRLVVSKRTAISSRPSRR